MKYIYREILVTFFTKFYILAINLGASLVLVGVVIFFFWIPYRIAALQKHDYVISLDANNGKALLKNSGSNSQEGFHIVLLNLAEMSEQDIWQQARLLEQEQINRLDAEALFQGFKKKDPWIGDLALAVLLAHQEKYEPELKKQLEQVFANEEWNYRLMNSNYSYFTPRKILENECRNLFQKERKNFLLLLDILYRLNLHLIFESFKSYLENIFSEQQNELFQKIIATYGNKREFFKLLETPDLGLEKLQSMQDWQKDWDLWSLKAIFHTQINDWENFDRTVLELPNSQSKIPSIQKLPGFSKTKILSTDAKLNSLFLSTQLVWHGIDFIPEWDIKIEILKKFLVGYYHPKMKDWNTENEIYLCHHLWRSLLLQSIWEILATNHNHLYPILFNILQNYTEELQKDIKEQSLKNSSFELFWREYQLLLWYLVSLQNNENPLVIFSYFSEATKDSSEKIFILKIPLSCEIELSQKVIPPIFMQELQRQNKNLIDAEILQQGENWVIRNNYQCYIFTKQDDYIIVEEVGIVFHKIPKIVIGGEIQPLVPSLTEYLKELQKKHFDKILLYQKK